MAQCLMWITMAGSCDVCPSTACNRPQSVAVPLQSDDAECLLDWDVQAKLVATWDWIAAMHCCQADDKQPAHQYMSQLKIIQEGKKL